MTYIPQYETAVLQGTTDSGDTEHLPADANGHLEVAIHAPRLPFGAVHTENLLPIFQADAIYGVNPVECLTTTNASGTATASDSAFVCTTGTTIYGAGAIQSRQRLRYRPGQGVVGRFTALYTTGVASSYQVAGFGHAEDGLYFGYKGTQFGILYNQRGVRETQTLTISTKSSHAENVVVTLAGTAFNIAVTNGASTVVTAYEISRGTYTGWKAEAVDSTVIFVADSVGNKTGTFSLTGTSVVGAFVETKAGAAVTESFIAQADWNKDPCNGAGPTGFTLDPTKFNVYQINIQYLGAGVINFMVEAPFNDNNADWVIVHSLQLPNTLTRTSLGNPSFPFTMSAYSEGSTTALTVKCGSYAGFIEGQKKTVGPRLSYYGQSTGVGSANLTALFTIRNTRYYGGRTNQAVINLLSFAGAIKHTSPVSLYIIRNATLAGAPNFASYSSSSCSYWDTAGTTVTYSDNNQVVFSAQLGDTGDFLFSFTDDLSIQPGETITVAAKSTTGSPSYVTASINTREDQ